MVNYNKSFTNIQRISRVDTFNTCRRVVGITTQLCWYLQVTCADMNGFGNRNFCRDESLLFPCLSERASDTLPTLDVGCVIGVLGMNFCEILIALRTFSFQEMSVSICLSSIMKCSCVSSETSMFWTCRYELESGWNRIHTVSIGPRAGPHLNVKTVFQGMMISIIKIRRSWDGLIFIMGISILIIWHLYIDTDPRSCVVCLHPHLGTTDLTPLVWRPGWFLSLVYIGVQPTIYRVVPWE